MIAETSDPDPRAALARNLDTSLELLRNAKPLSDDAVHEIRKELKRARAALRLLRPAVGKPAYARENAALRDAARPLAASRDARVMLDTINALAKRGVLELPRADLVRVRRELHERHQRMLRQAGTAAVRGTMETLLAGVASHTAHWRMPRDALTALRAGMEQIYRSGRKAVRGAETSGSDRALHEARKQAKYLGAAIANLAPPNARRVKKVIEEIDAIAQALGEDHDLAVLRTSNPRIRLDSKSIAAIRRRRGKLQKKGLKRAHRLFKRKPARFVARLRRAQSTG